MQKSGEARDIRLSKALSWLLRHGAVKEKLKISDDGYMNVNEVLRYKSISRYSLADIIRVVERNDKQRFSLRSNSTTNELEIKANQGHSIKVPDLELRPFECGDQSVLFHATYSKNWENIKQIGLSRMNRNHIHLNPGITAYSRQGCDVFIYVNANKLLEDGIPLYVAPNQVVLSPGNQEGIIHPKYFEDVKFKKSYVPQSKHMVEKKKN